MSMKHWLAALLLWPALTVAAPAAPTLKALLVDGQANPFHEWRKTSPIVKRALEETGLFTVEVATVLPGKAKDFKPKFSDYQVVVLNYEGEEWPAATKKAFEDYVAGGGGLVVFHAADNAFAHWKAYNEMIGVGGWEGRNEKNGPFLYWQDGKIVRDTSPGGGGQHGAQHAYQLVVRDAGASGDEGPAGEIPPRPRRALCQAPRSGQEPHRAGDGLLRQVDERDRPITSRC